MNKPKSTAKDFGSYISYELGKGVHVIVPKNHPDLPFHIRPVRDGFESITFDRNKYNGKTKASCINKTLRAYDSIIKPTK